MATLAARPKPVETDLKRTALIVVNVQNAYAKKGGMLDLIGEGIDEERTRPVIAAHERLLPAARAAGVKVIYLQFGYRPDLSDAGGAMSPNRERHAAVRKIRKGGPDRDKFITVGTWDWQIVDEIRPEPGDLVVPKARYSGFAGTAFESLLNGMDIRYLLFSGVATNVCVESTARDAYFAEFWPILIEDAMNHAGPDFTRDATLWFFETKAGWITDTPKVMEMLERSQA